jgi:hypothetical protein
LFDADADMLTLETKRRILEWKNRRENMEGREYGGGWRRVRVGEERVDNKEIFDVNADILTSETKASARRILEWRNRTGQTPLHLACATPSFKIANLLLSYGAEPCTKATREYARKGEEIDEKIDKARIGRACSRTQNETK